MTYLETYKSLPTVEDIKSRAFEDTWIATILGNDPDRIKAIEDAMNKAIAERNK